ncbi:MAG: hypothetical protein NZ602_11950 [Thermoguttaceae bacterium]|nr:hypothetical protein [Thermoguttaceae bacterium]MDW8038624.1 hypothetical protein [Thermoguttaceae bacterium]
MNRAPWIWLQSRSFERFKTVGRHEAGKGLYGLLCRLWTEQRGVLTFEWVLLLTLLVIGIVGGLTAARDALITELGDVAEAMISLDQSLLINPPWEVVTPACEEDGASGSVYVDEAYQSERRGSLAGQTVSSCSNNPDE